MGPDIDGDIPFVEKTVQRADTFLRDRLMTFAGMQPACKPDGTRRQCNLGYFCGVFPYAAPEAESPGKILQLHGSYRSGLTLEWLTYDTSPPGARFHRIGRRRARC